MGGPKILRSVREYAAWLFDFLVKDGILSSQTYSFPWHLLQDTIERALTATERMRGLPPPLNLQYSHLNNDFLL